VSGEKDNAKHARAAILAAVNAILKTEERVMARAIVCDLCGQKMDREPFMITFEVEGCPTIRDVSLSVKMHGGVREHDTCKTCQLKIMRRLLEVEGNDDSR
jgi:hypothetical protein